MLSKDQDAFAQGTQEGMARKCGVSEDKTEEAKCVEEAMLALMRVRTERNLYRKSSEELQAEVAKLSDERATLQSEVNGLQDERDETKGLLGQLMRYHETGNHKGLSGFLSPGGTDTIFTAKIKAVTDRVEPTD